MMRVLASKVRSIIPIRILAVGDVTENVSSHPRLVVFEGESCHAKVVGNVMATSRTTTSR